MVDKETVVMKVTKYIEQGWKKNKPMIGLEMAAVTLAQEIDNLNMPPFIPEQKEKLYVLSIQELKFMERFGWEIKYKPKAIKRDLQTGKVLAHEGDETWTRDLKVAGE